ncbi:hypothetical protein C4E24_06290 [ANME-1 cluster archaeon AG-394-G21]|nr:hypothetical protein [ANME-1 cluster archaeon AG-394-G21]
MIHETTRDFRIRYNLSQSGLNRTRMGQHLVDIFDFDIAEVIFFRKTKSRPVEIVLEYVSDRERDINSKTEENYDEICSGCEDVRVHQLDIFLDGYNN